MTDLRSRLRPVFHRAQSASSVHQVLSQEQSSPTASAHDDRTWRTALRLGKHKKSPSTTVGLLDRDIQEQSSPPTPLSADCAPDTPSPPERTRTASPLESPRSYLDKERPPELTIEQATPETSPPFPDTNEGGQIAEQARQTTFETGRLSLHERPPSIATRRRSPLSFTQSAPFSPERETLSPSDSRNADKNRAGEPSSSKRMSRRKIWVRRPHATPTQVAINEDDLVDDVKDMILRKYANSLGRDFDPPDVVLKVALTPKTSRHSSERILGPDETICRVLETYYSNGQSMDEALIIDVPKKRTPQQSPRVPTGYYATDELRPSEHGKDYFPPMPLNGATSPHLNVNLPPHTTHPLHHKQPTHPHSISVIETGHVPDLPSPGAGRNRRNVRPSRPSYPRQKTNSPTTAHSAPHIPIFDTHKSHVKQSLPTPPTEIQRHTATPPPNRMSSPRPGPKTKRSKKNTAFGGDDKGQLKGLLNGPPPINVLIVEDNIINLRLLEAFLKRLKVRYSSAMNGQIAVDKWRQGGFHLVLMDIQLPVMNGLDATKEIRRLERVNNIGVFANGAGSITNGYGEDAGKGIGSEGAATQAPPSLKPRTSETTEKDNLDHLALFMSPVIIVALTASSLQSDRHEALAAGCNDFLTKPVNFDWLSRKVMEWGCMQALIDYDGWRKWKDLASETPATGQKKKSSIANKTTVEQNKTKAEAHVNLANNSTSSLLTNGSSNERNGSDNSLEHSKSPPPIHTESKVPSAAVTSRLINSVDRLGYDGGTSSGGEGGGGASSES